MMLRADNPTPLYKQLYLQIQTEIESGVLQAGDKLPSMRELAADYGISRLTVKKAIELLDHEGLVRTYQGVGVFVEPRSVGASPSLPEHSGPFSSVQEENTATKTLSVDIVLADETLAERLKIKLEEKVVKIEQVRLSGGIPVALEESWIPYRLCSHLLDSCVECEPLQALATRAHDFDLGHTDEVVQAALATDRELSLLGLQPPAALLTIHRTTYDTEDGVVEYAQIVFPENRYRIEMPSQQWQ